MKSGVYLSPDGEEVILVETIYIEGLFIEFDFVSKIPLINIAIFGEGEGETKLISNHPVGFSCDDWHFLGDL